MDTTSHVLANQARRSILLGGQVVGVCSSYHNKSGEQRSNSRFGKRTSSRIRKSIDSDSVAKITRMSGRLLVLDCVMTAMVTTRHRSQHRRTATTASRVDAAEPVTQCSNHAKTISKVFRIRSTRRRYEFDRELYWIQRLHDAAYSRAMMQRLNEEAEQKKSRRRQPCRSINQDEDQHTDPIKTPPVSIPDTGDHVKPTIESPAEDAPPICTIQQQPATIPHLEYVGLDEQNNTAPPPSALAKLVDYCEELKRQNDDVKKQLLNQQGILEGLRSSLATAGSGKPALNMDSCTTSTSSNRGSKQASDPGYIKAGVGIPIQTRPRLSRGETRIPLPPSTTFRAAGRQILNSGDKPTSCEMGKTAAFHINDSKKATPIEISLETGATPNTEEPSTPDDCKQEEISSYRINASELQTKIIHDGDDVRSITGSTQSKVGTARHTTPSSSPIAPNRDEERVESGPSLPVIDDNLNDTTMNVNHSTHTGELCGTTVSVIESPVTRLQSTLVCGSPQSATHETLKPLQPASDEPDLAGDCELRSYSLTVVDGPSTYIANEMSIADVFRGRYVKR